MRFERGIDSVGRPCDLARYATALAALVETLGAPAHVCGVSWGGTVTLELYRRRLKLVATLVLADTYAGWKASLPEHEPRARVADAERMLTAPAETFHPTVPGLFAAEPPRDVSELLDAVAADVRPESVASRWAQSPRPICGTCCRVSQCRPSSSGASSTLDLR